MPMRVKAALVIMSIFIAVTAAYFFLSVSFTRQNLIETMERDLSMALDIAEDLVSTKIRLLESNAATTAEHLLMAGSLEEMTKIMASQMNESPEIMALTIIGREGIVTSYGRPDISDKEKSYVERAFMGESILSSTRYDSETGALILFLFVPMGQDKVLAMTLRGMIFSDFLSNCQLWQNGNIFIVDRDGTIIAHYRPELVRERYNFIEKAKTDPELQTIGSYFQIIITSERGRGTYYLDGLKRLTTHKRVSIPGGEWHIAVAVYLNESPEVNVRKDLLFSALAFLVIGILASVLISGVAVKPFYRIEEQNRKLVELNENCRTASEAKSKFLANMSHEMRTPLNAIIGLSELTLETGGLNQESHSDLEKINNAGITLLGTVNDILDISKIEAGKLELIPVEYDLANLINDAITQSILHIGEKPIRFILDVDGNLPTHLFGDELRIKQIFNNLLSNAFKYTKEGMVELGVNCTADDDTVWLSIRVRDTGIGIRSEDLGSLFDDYSQIDTTSNRKIEGTGLGLSIMKKIAELMDGSVTVESEFGKGSLFTVKLRQRFVTGAVIGEEVAVSLREFRYSDHRRRRNSQAARVKLPYARVLIVDDVATNLDVARGMMKPYMIQIDCVTSGKKAVDAIRDEKVKYNAVFMDHMMPEMDGIEATRIIREEIGTEYAKTVPIIALTANALLGNEEMFLMNGFQAFISKPLDGDSLDAIIQQWIRDKDLERTLTEKNTDAGGKTYMDIRSGNERRTVSERRSGIDRRTFGKIVTGIDLTRGLERFGGDEESFLQVLRSYAVNTPPLLETARRVNKGNLPDYAVTVHGIKGSSQGICAELISAKAEALEKAAKEGNYDFVKANNTVFIEAVESLIGDLRKMFARMAEESSKPKKDKPDSDVLRRLFTACEHYDMDGVDTAMADIEDYEYESDDGLAVWLRENVDQMNFMQIRERLSILIG